MKFIDYCAITATSLKDTLGTVLTKKKPKSTHVVEVVPVKLEPHPNADSLSLVRIGGYCVVVKTADWQGIDRGAYIQPDSVVPDTVDYNFLGRPVKDEHGRIVRFETPTLRERRITAKKFRGERSEGLLVKAPWGAKIGDNVAEKLGVTRYISLKELKEQQEAELQKNWWRRINRRGRKGLQFEGNEKGPQMWVPVYDLENWYKFGDRVFKDGEQVVITEKIHGCNARFMYSSVEGRMFVGSRSTWKKPFYVVPHKGLIKNVLTKVGLMEPIKKDSQDDWNKILRQYPGLEELCKAYPDCVFFGEIYGDKIQDLTYGFKGGETALKIFDVFECKTGLWWAAEKVWNTVNVLYVPVLYKGPYSEKAVRDEIDGQSKLCPSQIKEGCVIEATDGTAKPASERRILKAVSSAYLERASKAECDAINDARKVGA